MMLPGIVPYRCSESRPCGEGGCQRHVVRTAAADLCARALVTLRDLQAFPITRDAMCGADGWTTHAARTGERVRVEVATGSRGRAMDTDGPGGVLRVREAPRG